MNLSTPLHFLLILYWRHQARSFSLGDLLPFRRGYDMGTGQRKKPRTPNGDLSFRGRRMPSLPANWTRRAARSETLQASDSSSSRFGNENDMLGKKAFPDDGLLPRYRRKAREDEVPYYDPRSWVWKGKPDATFAVVIDNRPNLEESPRRLQEKPLASQNARGGNKTELVECTTQGCGTSSSPVEGRARGRGKRRRRKLSSDSESDWYEGLYIFLDIFSFSHLLNRGVAIEHKSVEGVRNMFALFNAHPRYNPFLEPSQMYVQYLCQRPLHGGTNLYFVMAPRVRISSSLKAGNCHRAVGCIALDWSMPSRVGRLGCG